MTTDPAKQLAQRKEALKIKKQNLILNNKKIEQEKEEIMLDRLKESRIERDYYKDNAFKSLGVLIFTLLTFVSSGFFSYYSYQHYSPPSSFIALDEEGRILEEISLDTDVMSDEELTQWANESLIDILSYNYLSFDKHGSKIKDYFSDKAYSDFSAAFNGLRLQKKVKVQKAIVQAVMTKPTQISQTGMVAANTRKAWMLKGEVILNIHGKDGIERVKYDLDVLIIRTTFKENKLGILIEKVQLTN
jgi:hypothetical protein